MKKSRLRLKKKYRNILAVFLIAAAAGILAVTFAVSRQREAQEETPAVYGAILDVTVSGGDDGQAAGAEGE